MYPRHRLDISPRHLALAGAACVRPPDPEQLEREIEAALPEGALVCFSVRSAFELLLDALDLPRGSELLLTAITHPDMARIVEQRHGLVPVPVDLELSTLAPQVELLENAVTQRTQALVVAHLFGGRADLTPLAAFARAHDLVLVEDCAQSIRGAHDAGDPRADVALFSFGSIKTAPALGGAVAYVRDPALLARMRELQAAWPRQPTREYALRVVRFAGLISLGEPHVYEAFVRAGSLAGLDVDALVNKSVHALRPPDSRADDEFGRWLRRRPSPPLLALLRHRLRTFDAGRLRRRAERGERAARALPPWLVHPGREALERTHWVFPVVPPSPRALIDELRRAGFDATAATSSIAAVDAPPGRPELVPHHAKTMMERVVFVPVYPEIPEPAFRRLLATLAALPAPAEVPKRQPAPV